ncbi:hypothetical protein [Amaricoccus sp.]|uniref:hypothetical protein n=1 Tax=Amaricoccus sp. TaxID=1872485 RepID=UPI001B5F395B|nr:hypothetical protein [Amaricoccus sp.]MBP7002488.1 hypothetical protein [Amaricoccus sp.]
MKFCILAAAAALGIGSAAVADTGQLAASAGIGAGEAAGLSLGELARHKFNADARADDHIAVVVVEGSAPAAARAQLAAAAGIDPAMAAGMSLTELAEAKIRAEARGDDRQPEMAASAAATAPGAQFVAKSGIDPEVARSLSVNEVFLADIVRRSDDD